tara:strand:+ start:4782 stop:4943 length:162 start_codon:yes stop_codon:yes gene_type:complete
MKMNEETKLIFALEHVAHLEDYIERGSPLFLPLATIKIELQKQLKHEIARKQR